MGQSGRSTHRVRRQRSPRLLSPELAQATASMRTCARRGGSLFRHRPTRVLAILTVLLGMLCAGAGFANAQDWPNVGGDTGRSGFNAAESGFSPDKALAIDEAWTTEAFAGMTSPVVSDGLAYTGSQG